MDETIRWLDATAQAALVARGEIHPRDLLAGALEAAATAQIGAAIPIRFDDLAKARAGGALTGPFAGVPFLLKDHGQAFAGAPNTSGSRALRHRIPADHSFYARRCLAAGLVIFGRTATPELGIKAVTESALWGPTLNPWDRTRTPGGSSGGSAAAVAAGIAPMAGADDGGGSIRIPASFCGLFGFKPSSGLVSYGPQEGLHWDGASVAGVLTRSVRDSAAMLDVLAGPEPGDSFPQPRPAIPFATAIGQPPRRLRIGFDTRSPLGNTVDPAAVAAVAAAAKLLGELGHVVEPAAPAIDGALLARTYLTLNLGQIAADVRAAGGRGAGFERETRAIALLGEALSAADYVRSRQKWNDLARALAGFFETYDMFLLPTVAAPPAKIGETDLPAWQRRLLALVETMRGGRLMLKANLIDKLAYDSLARTPFTQLSNLTLTPSMSVPLAMAPPIKGAPALPVGVQFMGRFGDDALLLQLAAQLEQAAPWSGRRP